VGIDVNWLGSSDRTGVPPQMKEAQSYVQLNTAQLTALGLPNDGTQKYAILSYLANPITLSAGDIQLGAEIMIKGPSEAIAAVDPVRGLKVDSSQTVSRTNTVGIQSTFVALSTAGKLGTITGSISGLGTYIQLFDTSIAPVSGITPLFTFYVDTDGTFSFDYGEYGFPVLSGLAIASSSVYGTYTPTETPKFTALITYW
jgi:hypothetical protein